MQFVRMIQFTRLIKINGRVREYNFRKLNSPDEELFTVNVVNDRGERVIFGMKKKDGNWKFVGDNIPDWISAGETEINQAIAEEFQTT